MTDENFIPTIGVTGFGRCGSTMIMAMLDAGGVPPVIGSDERSYEVGDIRSVADLPRYALNGRAVKLLDSAAYYGVPPADEWRFIWMDRDYRQQAKSMVKFAEMVGLPRYEGDEDAIAMSYPVDRPKTLRLYRAAGKVLVLRYEAVLADPLRAARALRRLVLHLDVLAAAAVVHRRLPECRPDLNFELTGICGVTDEDECPHGLDSRWCGVCLHGPTRPQPVTVEATFTARFDGHCSPCNLLIAAGQIVSKLSDGRYVHQSCV